MLQIYIFGPTEEGYLDIEQNTVLHLESLAEAWDEDLSTGEFSLPADFPWTDNNRRLLGFAERLENFTKAALSWRCIVFYKGFPELPVAKLTILEKSGNFSYRRGKFSASISGSKGLFGNAIKNKRLRSLHLGGKISWYRMESRKFAEDLMKGSYPQFNYISFAPVAFENFFVKDRPDYTNEFLAKDTVNTVVITGAGANDWKFGRPKSTAPSMDTIPRDPEHKDYRTIPFLNLKWLVAKVFEEAGYTVSGAVFDNTDFDDLFVFNNYAIEVYSLNIASDYNNAILPQNHVPDLTVKEFLKGIYDAFNVYPTFPEINKVKLVSRQSNFTNKKILNLNDVISGEFTSTAQEFENANGYKLNYVWDSNDSYYSDRVKDISSKTLVATVAKFTNLATLNIARQLTTDDIAFVEADNLYYNVADGTTSPIKWDVYSERLNEYVQGNGERSVDCNISTLCTYVEFNTLTGLYEKRNYVGCRQAGSYYNNKGVRVLNPFGLRIFYIKKQSINGALVPVSFNHNRNKNNDIIEPYSLAWQGVDGLATLHKAWQDMREHMEVVKTKATVDQRILTNLQQHNIYEKDNVQYLPYKIERSIPGKEIELQLVPL